MKFSTLSASAVLLQLASAHVRMYSPAPYNNDMDNSPLAGDGSNFPCKLSSAPQAYSQMMTYTPGQVSQFQLQGSAVHGGGSCQISITYDNPPTKDSVFKVVQSYEGGCPVNTAGNLPANAQNLIPAFDVTLPQGIKSGEAVFVWTWFNKIGNREMYMNCAPINIAGSETSTSVYDALPDMFVANIQGVSNGCSTTEGIDIVYPNGGDNKVVEAASSGANFGPPVCPNGAGGSSGSYGGSSGSSGSSGGAPSSAPAASSVMPSPTPSASYGQIVPGAGLATSSMSAPGTVFTPINGPVSTTFSTVYMTTTSAAAASSMPAPAPAPSSYAPPSSNGGSSSSGGSYGSGSSHDGSSGSGSSGTGSSGTGSSGSGSYGSGSSSGSAAVSMGSCNQSSGVIQCKSGQDNVYAQCYGSELWGYFPTPAGVSCSTFATFFTSGGSSNSSGGSGYGRRVRRIAKEHIKRFHAHHS